MPEKCPEQIARPGAARDMVFIESTILQWSTDGCRESWRTDQPEEEAEAHDKGMGRQEVLLASNHK